MLAVNRMRFTPAAIALAAAMAACDRGGPEQPETPMSPSVSVAPADQVLTLDDEWAQVAQREVPGFAGYYVDESGGTVVLVTAAGSPAAAEAYVARQGRRAIAAVRQVRWDFAQLKSWRDQLASLLERAGVYTLDIDEVRNQIRLGVMDEATRGPVVAEAARLGVAPAAVVAEIEPPPEVRLGLKDRVRPVRAGFQIYQPDRDWNCTLGFNASIGGQPRFLTASHCSITRNSLDFGVMRQASAADEIIGSEVADRVRWTSCLHDPRPSCRWSDVSIFAYSSEIASEFGYLTRTTFVANGAPGSLTVDDANPRFTIIAKLTDSQQPVGTWIHKVGRTSGWTKGQVTRTCVYVGDGYNCQWVTRTWSQLGDSGSPMFTEPAVSDIGMAGVLWGGPAGDWTTTYYSTSDSINKDFVSLGTISVCATGAC